MVITAQPARSLRPRASFGALWAVVAGLLGPTSVLAEGVVPPLVRLKLVIFSQPQAIGPAEATAGSFEFVDAPAGSLIGLVASADQAVGLRRSLTAGSSAAGENILACYLSGHADATMDLPASGGAATTMSLRLDPTIVSKVFRLALRLKVGDSPERQATTILRWGESAVISIRRGPPLESIHLLLTPMNLRFTLDVPEVESPHVTLDLEGVPGVEAVRALGDGIGLPIFPEAELPESVSLHLEDASVEDAVDALAKALGLAPVMVDGNVTLVAPSVIGPAPAASEVPAALPPPPSSRRRHLGR